MIQASGARVYMMGTKPEPHFAQPNTANLLSTYQAYDVKVQGLAASLAASAGTRKLPPLVVYDSYNSLIDKCNPYSFYQNDLFHLSKSGYNFVETSVKAMLADSSGCQVWQWCLCARPRCAKRRSFAMRGRQFVAMHIAIGQVGKAAAKQLCRLYAIQLLRHMLLPMLQRFYCGGREDWLWQRMPIWLQSDCNASSL